MKKYLSNLLILLTTFCFSQTNINEAMVSCSITSSNNVNRTIGIVGQTIDSSYSFSSSNLSFNGFMGSYVMFPEKDANEDGIPDESTLDNDGDQIMDLTELNGSSFNPVTPTDTQLSDSDWDGVPDNIELMAGTDPSDPSSYLAIQSIDSTSSNLIITWKGRAQIDYQIVLYTNMLNTNDMFYSPILNSTSGSGPWQTNLLSWTNSCDISTKYYRIRVIQ